jgi:branched-chain amino acid transport system substrate-binding protein
MKKHNIIYAGIGMVVLIIFTIFISSIISKDEYIKVGAVLPLTGEGTVDQGQASQNAILLAIEEINNDGGILGKKVKTIIEDSRGQASTGVTAIKKLIEIDNVDFVIGDISDSSTAAIIPIAMQNKVVLITPGSTSPDISNAGEYIFRFWFSESELGGMVAEEAINSNNRNIAILYVNNAWGVAQKNGVTKRLEELGGVVVSEQAIDPTHSDYRTTILKAEENEPDAYYIGLHPNGLAQATKQLNDLNINKQIYSHGGLVGSTQTLGLGGDHLEGIIAPFVYEPNSNFIKKYRLKYDSAPGITADSSYDAVKAVLSIIQVKGDSSSDAIKEGLLELKDYEGVSGQISVDKNGDVQRPLRLMIVSEGKLIPLR